MIPYGKQDINESDIDSVIKILRSDYLTQGPAIPRFEKALEAYCNTKFGVAVSSATAALHLACLALDLGPGKRLWTSPISFLASANCGLYCGAEVDFVDIDPETYNICPSSLEAKLVSAEKNGVLPSVVVVVHFAGLPCEMDKIRQLSRKYGFYIIEDASHAMGAEYNGSKIGSCEYSELTVFSFHPVKIITTGEGGIITTNNDDIAKRVTRLRSHGVTRERNDFVLSGEITKNNYYYEQIELGYNYRLTDLQAALGESQLLRLDDYVKRRNEVAKVYNTNLANLPIKLPARSLNSLSSYHLFPIWINPNNNLNSRDLIYKKLNEFGVGAQVHYIPIHLQPFYQKKGYKMGDFPKAENYFAGALSLPIFPRLTEDQQLYVITKLQQLLG